MDSTLPKVDSQLTRLVPLVDCQPVPLVALAWHHHLLPDWLAQLPESSTIQSRLESGSCSGYKLLLQPTWSPSRDKSSSSGMSARSPCSPIMCTGIMRAVKCASLTLLCTAAHSEELSLKASSCGTGPAMQHTEPHKDTQRHDVNSLPCSSSCCTLQRLQICWQQLTRHPCNCLETLPAQLLMTSTSLLVVTGS